MEILYNYTSSCPLDENDSERTVGMCIDGVVTERTSQKTGWKKLKILCGVTFHEGVIWLPECDVYNWEEKMSIIIATVAKCMNL